jgi:hypothetical protein
MLKGIYLTLMIGPLVPVPVPKLITDALTSLEVTSEAGKESVFQMTFNFSNRSPLNTLLLLLGQTGPFIRTIIVATVNGTPHVLIDGMIDHHQLTPNVQTGESTFTVTGTDLTSIMGYFDFTGFPYPCMPLEARVALIIAKYAMFGMIPLVIPSLFMDIPLPMKEIPVQQGSDLEYIRLLASKVGHVFYIEPGPAPGMNIAYWGPELKVGVPQPALNINMDAHTNIDELHFSYNGSSKSMPVIYIQNEESKAAISIPIPDISPLNPSLGLIPAIPVQFPMMKDVAGLSPVQAISKGMSEASQSSDVVTGGGSLDVLRYGHILKARSLVGVRGAGMAFDGLYFVKSVKHKIQRGQYKQDFSLARNGLISTVPLVPA